MTNNWSFSIPIIFLLNMSECFTCKKEFDKILKCGACKNVSYCGTECQKKDWKNHKLTCNKVSVEIMETKQESKDSIPKELTINENSSIKLPPVDPKVKNWLQKVYKGRMDIKTGVRFEPPCDDDCFFDFEERYGTEYSKFYNINPNIIKLVDQDLSNLPSLLNLCFDQKHFQNDQILEDAAVKIINILFEKTEKELENYYEELVLFFYQMLTDTSEAFDLIHQALQKQKGKQSKILHIYLLEGWKRASSVGTFNLGYEYTKFLSSEGIEMMKKYFVEELKDPLWRFPHVLSRNVFTLCHLKAVEYLPIIRNVFEKNCIDISYEGGYDKAVKLLGLKEDTKDPLFKRYSSIQTFYF